MIRNFLNRKENFGIESDKLLKPFVIADQQSGEHIRKMRKFEIADEGELNDSDMHNGNGCRPEDKYTAPGEPVALMYGDLLDVKVLE